MLMDLAAPEVKFPPARDLDGLEDDVATLSYERALRMHSRYRPANADQDAHPVPFTSVSAAVSAAAEPSQAPAATVPAPAPPALERKSASVTVRLCHAEGERLRQRAAESGLTVSEYMRSCVFEVETLRAQVKETLATLRAQQNEPAPRPTHWWKRLLDHSIPVRRRA